MEVNVNRPLIAQDPAAKALVEELESGSKNFGLDSAILYYNFPLYRDVNDAASRVHVLLASPIHGVIVFECTSVGPESIAELADTLDQAASQVLARLIKSRRLRSGPQRLKVPLHQAFYMPGDRQPDETILSEFPHVKLCPGVGALEYWLSSIALSPELQDSEFRETVAILEGSTGIISPKERDLSSATPHTKGKVLRDIEVALANFDRDQKSAAMNIIDGPQRIRGLAGSGKTIVLAWKAALLHLQNPSAKIVYSYYTKALYPLIKSLITRFFRHYAERDPDWQKLIIMHAWGGKYLPGVYWEVCKAHAIDPMTLDDARQRPGDSFDVVCTALLEHELRPQFDYAILDEGQDFPASFYRVCYRVTQNGRVIWGYDECQNILNVEIQDPRETFGKGSDGTYLVDLDASSDVQNNVVLHRCYRNPRHVIIFAFALGLGLYNDPILQMLENNEHWEDLGFRVREGNSQAGDQMVVERPVDNTPLVVNQLFGEAETIAIEAFDSIDEECAFVVDSILEDLESELLPEDILVVSLDDRFSRTYFRQISRRLAGHHVETFNLLEAPSNMRRFTQPRHVTLSTVYRAKGNEAGSVYVVGVDSVYAQKDSIVMRNKLFTAMTRAKGWLTVSGCGSFAKVFLEECQRVHRSYPRLVFTMPDCGSLTA